MGAAIYRDAPSFTGRRWALEAPPPESVDPLIRTGDLHESLARCLAGRGIRDPHGARRYLAPSLRDLHDPFAMTDMEPVVERIRRALTGRERIRIATDYDVDGTTSSLILQAALKALDGDCRVEWDIPDRFEEGYGLGQAMVERAAQEGTSLLLTADIGVRDHEAVTQASGRGMDVIICDHHLPRGDRVPSAAFAVLCPPRAECSYPNPDLAACGIAFKLAQALLQDHPRRDRFLASLLKVAAIGTVADVVDLGNPENRAIVALGLEALNRGPNAPGLRALLEVSGCTEGPITAGQLGFRIGPRINAAGRMAHARAAVSLLQERRLSRARALAHEIDQLNGQRQQVQRKLVDRILREILPASGAAGGPPPATERLFPVFAGPEEEGWHRGVVGIVASRVRDRIHLPVAVAALDGDQATGSIRSIPGIHAVEALDSASDLLDRYGGHPVAAGFGLARNRLEALEERLGRFVAQRLTPEQRIPVLRAELERGPHQLGDRLARELDRLAPFGRGNPRPRIAVTACRPQALRVVGDRHLFFRVGDTEAVWWQGAEYRAGLTAGPVELLGTHALNTWRGATRPRFTVEDARNAP